MNNSAKMRPAISTATSALVACPYATSSRSGRPKSGGAQTPHPFGPLRILGPDFLSSIKMHNNSINPQYLAYSRIESAMFSSKCLVVLHTDAEFCRFKRRSFSGVSLTITLPSPRANSRDSHHEAPSETGVYLDRTGRDRSRRSEPGD